MTDTERIRALERLLVETLLRLRSLRDLVDAAETQTAFDDIYNRALTQRDTP